MTAGARVPSGLAGGRIVGWGTALPDKVVTNDDLAAMMDTTHDWIVERTGIHERRIGGTTIGLATEAGRAAIERAGLTPADIDLVILATISPDQPFPASACGVQDALGITGGAIDVNAACSGFVYGLVAAHGLIALGGQRVLVIGAETLHRYIDWNDRSTAILFADGAAAAVVEPTDGPGSLLAWDLGADGSAGPLLFAEHGQTVQMDGKEVFRKAVRVMVESAERTLARAGVSVDELAVVIPHQANLRIIEAACHRLGIPMDKSVNVLAHTGNTSAASVPLALASALDAQRIADGDLVLLVGFGAGMTWASALLRWGER